MLECHIVLYALEVRRPGVRSHVCFDWSGVRTRSTFKICKDQALDGTVPRKRRTRVAGVPRRSEQRRLQAGRELNLNRVKLAKKIFSVC